MKKLFGTVGVVLLAYLMASCVPVQTPTVSSDAFLTLNLTAGHPLDPLLFSVNGGGEVDAATLAPACSGFITTSPTVALNWTGDAEFVEVFFYSDHDPTLVIQTPDGSYLCGDDANDQILDPVIEMQQPSHGEYKIWVGSFAADQLIPGFLVLTTQSEINIGTLQLENLVRRDAIPEALPESVERFSMEALQAKLGAAAGQADVHQIAPADSPVMVEITATGEVHASELDLPLAGCSGFIGEAPDYIFAWDGTEAALNIFFAAEMDSTLVVVNPNGEVLCNDDAVAGENLNPAISIENPQPGRYGVFVGRLQLENPVTGQLTIDFGADAQPSVLAPSQEGN